MASRFVMNPNFRREVESSEPVRAFLAELGDAVVDELRKGTEETALRTEARAGNGLRHYTGALAQSWSYRVEVGDKQARLLVGSGVKGGNAKAYAGVFLYGYDPSGPRGTWRWYGSDVVGDAFVAFGMTYRRPYPYRGREASGV